MILVGIDDTDTIDSAGTNQLARRLAARLPAGFRCRRALRHQLFFDPRVPYTSHNGSASLLLEGDVSGLEFLVAFLRREMLDWFVPGSDPGLCVARETPPAVQDFGRLCQRDVVTQADAHALAKAHGLHLEGLGGTNGGVIGALAAVGLLAGGDDGRVIHLEGWRWPDDFDGDRAVDAILARGVDEIRVHATGERLTAGQVQVGRHLRPNVRGGRIVLFVEADSAPGCWRALKLP